MPCSLLNLKKEDGQGRNAYCLSRKTNAESGQGIKPRRARRQAQIAGVALLENGTTILLHRKPCHCTLVVTQRK